MEALSICAFGTEIRSIIISQMFGNANRRRPWKSLEPHSKQFHNMGLTSKPFAETRSIGGFGHAFYHIFASRNNARSKAQSNQ